MSDLARYLSENEEWLMERILRFAKDRGYVAHTSCQLKDWQCSVAGLTSAIAVAEASIGEGFPELFPEQEFSDDSITEFAREEARLHRQRGIPFALYLGLHKYFKFAYLELVERMQGTPEEIARSRTFINKFFDYVELAFTTEWTQLGVEEAVHELRQENKALVMDKGKYQTLFYSLNMPVFLIDESGVIENFNLEAASLLGAYCVPGEERVGDAVHEIDVGKNLSLVLPWLRTEIKAFLSGTLSSDWIEKSPRFGSEYRHYLVGFSRMKGVTEEFSGGLVTIEDCTERKMLELQLSQSQKMESIGQLASGVAHEINTPIQFIGVNVDFLQETFAELMDMVRAGGETDKKDDLAYLEEEIPKALRETKEGVQRVTTIVQALKRFAHPGQQSQTKLSLNEMGRNVLEISRNEWKLAAELEMNLAPDLKEIEAAPGEINQILLNLVINAIHAIKADTGTKPGRLSITTRNVDNDVEIVIKDNGCGIPKGIAHRLFDPFFTTKDVGEGTGQGLFIVHNLVVANNGDITFQSKEGVGSEFSVRFPAVD